MTTRQKLEERGINLNTLILLASLLGGIFATIKIGGPLLNVPEKMAEVDEQLGNVSDKATSIERTQAIQTEALKTLADLAKESRDLRRDFDKTTADHEAKHREASRLLDGITRRLDRLEGH
jgi:hypothetical protein